MPSQLAVKALLACALSALIANTSIASEMSGSQAAQSAHAPQPDLMKTPAGASIINTISAIQTELKIVGIAETPSSALYAVTLEDGSEVYSTTNGNFILTGNLFANQDGKVTNLTALAERKNVLAKLSALKDSDMIVYPAEGKMATITVFTDVDCPYCQVLHKDIPKLNAAGIEVRYLAFPRMGLNSETYRKMEQVWCSKDRRQAMDMAKMADLTATDTCENPVADQFHLAAALGVRGTPTVFLENGDRITGYSSPDHLIKTALAAKAN